MDDGERPLTGTEVLPGRFDPRFARFFGWYAERLARKRFHAIRLLRGDGEPLAAMGATRGPGMMLLNHPAWWDPLVALLVGRRFMPESTPMAPMERDQLRRFAFFRRLGLFGIDPDAPASLAAMADYVAERFVSDRQPVLWITPQGRFTDVRAPLRLRPGAAAIAARTRDLRVAVLALEYGFWEDQRPEVFLAAAAVPEPGPSRSSSTAAWHRALAAAMEATAARLAAAVVAREPAAFDCLVGGDAARIHPVYDWWLRRRGVGTRIDARR